MVPCTMDGSGAGPRLSSIGVGRPQIERNGQSTPEARGGYNALTALSQHPSLCC